MVYDPLTKESIEQAQEQRKKALKELLGNDPKITDNFKWKVGTEKTTPEEEEMITSGSVVVTPYSDKEQKTLDKEIENDNKKEQEDVNKAVSGMDLKAAEFKYMIHGFYNNLNAKVTDNSITVPDNNLFTDLHLNNNIVNNKEEVDRIITS